MNRILLVLFLVMVGLSNPSHAQSSAEQTTPGYLTTTSCPGGAFSCWMPYSSSVSGGQLPISVTDLGNHTGYVFTSNGSGSPATFQAGGASGITTGPCITNAGNVINTTQPADRTVSGATDTILSTDACKTIDYTDNSGAAITLPSAAGAGFTQGFAFTANNKSTGSDVITPGGGSTINGASTFTLPANTGCYVKSDGTNYQIDLSQCSSLPIASSVLPTNVISRAIGCSISGGGSVPSTGLSCVYPGSPFSGTITEWCLVSNLSGSIVVDVWKLNNAVPSIVNTITASALPTLSSQEYLCSSTLTGWTTSVAVGDVFFFNVNSASTLTTATLLLYVTTN